jgi:hypothetical protein
MLCYNVCPNCGQYMYEHRCRAVCPPALFFDCEDLFHYDESCDQRRRAIDITGLVSYTPQQRRATA